MNDDIFTLEVLEDVIWNCMEEEEGNILMVAKQSDGWVAMLLEGAAPSSTENEFYLDVSDHLHDWSMYYEDWAIQAYRAIS